MKIYAISGLGADRRAFHKLKLDMPIIHIEWIEPLKNESITKFAKRLSAKIDTKEDFIIMGVSFGGMIATEISAQLQPKLTILISSAETKHELRPFFRFIGKTGLLKILPASFFNPPKRIAKYLFGTSNTELLYQILDDTNLSFAKWAVNQLVKWDRTEKLEGEALKISGEKDKLIPSKGFSNSILIKDGEHFMIVDKAEEINEVINRKINSLQLV
ncbi:MAG: alpha/beta hydrolase [Fluviicola sp.]|nr:alpha/beta hydrolase [Fluviicola sp.]